MLLGVYAKKPPKQHYVGPRTLTLLVVLCAIFVISSATGRRPVGSYKCERGPLRTTIACAVTGADKDAKPEWYYSYATGTIDLPFCDKMSLNPDDIAINLTSQQNKVEHILKTKCTPLGLDETHFCYTSQYLSENGNSRITNVFITDSNCGNARFFRGINALLDKGAPKQATTNWKEPYPGINELK